MYNPNPLTLTRESPAGFVSISCEFCNSSENPYLLDVSIQGIDAAAFEMDQEEYFFSSGSRYDTPATVDLFTDDVTASSFALYLQTDQIGLATLCVIGSDAFEKDPEQASFDYIYNNSYILGEPDNGKPDLDALKQQRKDKIQKFQESAKDYRQLSQQILNAGRTAYFPAQVMVLNEDDDNLLGVFDQLVPNSLFHYFVYFNNFDGNGTVLYYGNVTTAGTPPHAKLTFNFNTVPSEEEFSAVMLQIFQLPAQNLDIGKNVFGGRRLDDSTVSVYSDVSSGTSAYDTATENKDTIESDTDSTVSIESVDESNYEAGAFEGTSTWTTDNGIYIEFNYTAAVEGSLFCTVEGNGTNLTSNEVYTGYNADGVAVNQYTDDISAGANYFMLNFTEEGEYDYGTYHVSCIVCNAYPGTPTCSDTVESTDYDYTGTDDNSSGAQALVVAIAAYLLF